MKLTVLTLPGLTAESLITGRNLTKSDGKDRNGQKEQKLTINDRKGGLGGQGRT